MKTEKRKTTAEVRESCAVPGTWLGIIETPKGLVYWCRWAADHKPTEAKVLQVWKEDRRAFEPGYGA